MVYEKQTWNKYDDLKTEEENIQNGAVVTDNRMNHMEDGISAIDLEVTSHESNKTNPHSVTKGQVGLSNVLNYGIATEAEATAGTSNAKYMTPLLTKKALNDSDIVHKSGDETITGAKTFSGAFTHVSQRSNDPQRAWALGVRQVKPDGTLGQLQNIVGTNPQLSEREPSNGFSMGISAGANMIYAAGEAHIALLKAIEKPETTPPSLAVKPNGETAILVADGATYIGTNYQNGGTTPTTGYWWRFDTDGILTAPGTIKAPTFSGKLDGNATSATTAKTTTGNAGTATKLGTARKINGTAFDGTKDINVKASNDSDIVHKSGDETIAGKKTFTNDMVVKNIKVTGDYKKSTDTEMINLPLSGVATATVSYQRKNGVVFVKGGGNWGNFEANKSRIVGTLPVGFRPPVAWPSGMNAMGGSQSMSASVGADGKLDITCDVKKDGVYGGFSTSFPVE